MHYLLSQTVDRTAERRPDHPAFRCLGEAVTYADLAARTSRLAHLLRDLGVQRGDRVGIYLHKSLASAVAIYGIWKAGAAYVPLDPALPTERLALVLRDCGIHHLITEKGKRRALAALAQADPELDLTLVGLGPHDAVPYAAHDWNVLDAFDTTPPDAGGMEQDIAYVMYTSGSTGTPKGIIHTHASGLSYAREAAAVYGVTGDDRLSNFPPLHFDQSTFDYFSGPLAGATTVIIPEAYTKLPASLSKLMEEERLTIWYSVPYALIQLLLHGVLEDRDLGSLRWVKFGGEPFPPKHLRALQALMPNARFSNVYGPAEVNQCTLYHVPTLAEGDDDPLPIGTIWPNADGLIVDTDGAPVADGEVGELLVRTPTMMEGYWNRPDLNADAFYYRLGPGGTTDRFYRTGDLVRRRPDGDLDFLGRLDRQVKTRGYRVELDEVEAALLTHDAVAETAVFPVPDASGTLRIEAAVIARDDIEITENDLRRHLAARLPAYAIPASLAVVDAFPRTSNGKIDRLALQAEAASAPSPA